MRPLDTLALLESQLEDTIGTAVNALKDLEAIEMFTGPITDADCR